MDLQSALLQLQANVRNQVEIILTNLAGVATREHFDEALYNQFIASRQAIPVIYGQMLGWSSQLNNMSFAQALQSLAEAINVITLDVDASLQQGIDDARKQSLINGVTNADTVMASFLQQHYGTIVQYYNALAAQNQQAQVVEDPPPAPPDDGDMPPPPPDDDDMAAPFVAVPANPPPTQTAPTQTQTQPTQPPPQQHYQPTPERAESSATVYNNQSAPTQQQYLTPPANSSPAQPTQPVTTTPVARASPVVAAPRVPWAGAINDLISTEQEYIQMVSGAANAYDAAFKTNLSRMKKIFSDSDLGAVQGLFSGLSLILRCHSALLAHIEAARAGTAPLGSSMKSSVITLKIYTDFMTNLDNNIELVRKNRKNKDFSKFLDECKAKSASNREIEDICAHTFKRLGQYDGLINAFIMNMVPQDPDYNDLKESQQLVRKVTEYIAQARSAAEARNKIIVIQQRVSSLPQGLNLVAPHRVLMRELDMDVRAHDSKKAKEMTVYAFNDMILITKTKGLVSKDEVCESIISYHDHKLEPATEGDRAGFKMVDGKKNAFWLFVPPDDATRTSWIGEIKAAIEQLKNSRATALVDEVDENELETKLQVRVFAGRDFVTSLYEPPDLYVVVSLGNTVRKSAVREKVRFCPEWEDKFVMTVKNPYEETVKIEVRERNNDTLLGHTTIPLDNLYDYVEKTGWFRLTSQLSSPTLEPEIFLGLMVAPTLTE